MPSNLISLSILRTPTAILPVRRCPIVVGVPFAQSACHDVSSLGARRPDGTPLPLQVRVLDRWADHSVRWALVSLQVDADVPGERVAEIGPGLPRLAASVPIAVTVAGPVTTVDTGKLRLAPGSFGAGPGILAQLTTASLTTHLRLSVLTGDGLAAEVHLERCGVEETGPLRSVIRLDGRVAHAGDDLLEAVVRLHAYAGHSAVRCDVQLRNPRAAVHRVGHWDLGDAGSVHLKGVTVVFDREDALDGVRCAPEVGALLEKRSVPFLLHQDSSGGANWRSTNHINSARTIPRAFRGYRLRSQGDVYESLRATPIVVLGDGDASLAVAMEHFWQNFPKAIASNGRSLELHLFPPHGLDVHEIQGGEQKTHTFHIAVGQDTISALPLDWARQPLVVHVDPSYCAHTGAIRHLIPEADDPDLDRLALIRAAIDGPDTFAAKREVIDEYGWRHFGDVYGDHEGVRHAGPTPLVSHYNNQYDPVEGFAVQFLRSADSRWWEAMRELAWHVADVDVYHTNRDKAAYNGGLFWHTVHYIDADTATHRTYPASSGHGGGPANEQNYVSGLALAWYLTGEAAFREAAVGLAEFPIRIDDGSQTVFRWLARGDTGLATSSGNPHYHGPGRGSGNSLSALVEGYRLTGERRYLDKAEQIIRRVIHPADDVEARTLLDAERKWFYTMFLQALGKYLDAKAQWGERDRMYAWARASLLHYARWMAANEYPYLDKPDILEFPTETWAAQDIRKSDVFHYAEQYAATPDERGLFRERARFFFRSSVDTLSASPTRTLARPVIVLLTSGRLHAWFERHREELAPPLPEMSEAFGTPVAFEPQKTRAVRRAKWIVACCMLAAVLGLGVVLSRLL
jgi:hypothetical protein